MSLQELADQTIAELLEDLPVQESRTRKTRVQRTVEPLSPPRQVDEWIERSTDWFDWSDVQKDLPHIERRIIAKRITIYYTRVEALETAMDKASRMSFRYKR